jgi:hypothetical protein
MLTHPLNASSVPVSCHRAGRCDAARKMFTHVIRITSAFPERVYSVTVSGALWDPIVAQEPAVTQASSNNRGPQSTAVCRRKLVSPGRVVPQRGCIARVGLLPVPVVAFRSPADVFLVTSAVCSELPPNAVAALSAAQPRPRPHHPRPSLTATTSAWTPASPGNRGYPVNFT